MPDIFADTLGQVSVASGVVRLELMSITPQPGPNHTPVTEKSGQIIMPLNGFIQVFRSMQDLMDKGSSTRRMEFG
jgi:hypothetical protein